MAKKKTLTVQDILPAFQKAQAIEEYCQGRYLDTHTIINTDDGVTLSGSERHAETSTELNLTAKVEKLTANSIATKDTSGNPIELRFFVLAPLPVF